MIDAESVNDRSGVAQEPAAAASGPFLVESTVGKGSRSLSICGACGARSPRLRAARKAERRDPGLSRSQHARSQQHHRQLAAAHDLLGDAAKDQPTEATGSTRAHDDGVHERIAHGIYNR